MKILQLIKDILSPKKCYSCDLEGSFLCKKCFEKQDNFTDFCYVCKKKSKKFQVHEECSENIFYDNLIVLTHYKNKLIKKLIIDFKFYNKKDIGVDFAQIMANKLLKQNLGILNNKNILITNAPMGFFRKLSKGYNQSEILASEVSKILGIKHEKNIFKKVKSTRQQSLLSKEKRQKNLQNAFKINKKHIDKLDNKTIILLDDVISTGTTINELSKLLKTNGTTKIIGLCIASD